MSLIEELQEARKAAVRQAGNDCKACRYLATMDPGPVRDDLEAALAGTIGTRTLAVILRKHDIPVGREAIVRHRKEGTR